MKLFITLLVNVNKSRTTAGSLSRTPLRAGSLLGHVLFFYSLVLDYACAMHNKCVSNTFLVHFFAATFFNDKSVLQEALDLLSFYNYLTFISFEHLLSHYNFNQ
jgi:hypothetical protein